MTKEVEFQKVFELLKSLLELYAADLVIQNDLPGDYILSTHFSEKFKKELFFGAAQIRKNYVSYHLMPVYMYPDLLDGISPELKKRMHGKSCFNFKVVDLDRLAELSQLTRRGFDRLMKEESSV